DVGVGAVEPEPDRDAPQAVNRGPVAPAPSDRGVPGLETDAGAEAGRVEPDPGPAVTDAAAGLLTLSSAAPPLRWDGVHDGAEAGAIAGVVGLLRAALVEMRRTLRRTDDDPWRAGRLWRAMGPCRERFAALLGAVSPQALTDCADCEGGGAASDRTPCSVCGGTGVVVTT